MFIETPFNFRQSFCTKSSKCPDDRGFADIAGSRDIGALVVAFACGDVVALAKEVINDGCRIRQAEKLQVAQIERFHKSEPHAERGV